MVTFKQLHGKIIAIPNNLEHDTSFAINNLGKDQGDQIIFRVILSSTTKLITHKSIT